MTTTAHHKRRVYAGASRTRSMEPASAPSTLFGELHPHLRNVAVGQQTLQQRIHDYLSRRPGRTLNQIAERMGGDSGRIERCVSTHPELFRLDGKQVYVK